MIKKWLYKIYEASIYVSAVFSLFLLATEFITGGMEEWCRPLCLIVSAYLMISVTPMAIYIYFTDKNHIVKDKLD